MRKANEKARCPYSPSCFDCPLPDCEVDGRWRYNPLPYDHMLIHDAALQESIKPAIACITRRKYTDAELELIWENINCSNAQICELIYKELGIVRSIDAIRSIKCKLKKKHTIERSNT